MKYYIHKETGEPMASMAELLDPVTGDNESDVSLERVGGCFTRVIFPNKWIGNGVLFHIMHYKEFTKFKRINKNEFFKLCPDFGQLRHFTDNTIECHSYMKLFDFGVFSDETIQKRKKTFGK